MFSFIYSFTNAQERGKAAKKGNRSPAIRYDMHVFLKEEIRFIRFRQSCHNSHLSSPAAFSLNNPNAHKYGIFATPGMGPGGPPHGGPTTNLPSPQTMMMSTVSTTPGTVTKIGTTNLQFPSLSSTTTLGNSGASTPGGVHSTGSTGFYPFDSGAPPRASLQQSETSQGSLLNMTGVGAQQQRHSYTGLAMGGAPNNLVELIMRKDDRTSIPQGIVREFKGKYDAAAGSG